MSNTNVLIHAVWGTKHNIPYLTHNVLETVIQHIIINAGSKGICIAAVNGHRDHLHCLISLSPQNTLAQVLQLMKGEVSFWMNKNRIIQGKFEWANEYYAVSVSPSDVKRVLDYIRDQQEHHARKSWEDEVNELLQSFGQGLKP